MSRKWIGAGSVLTGTATACPAFIIMVLVVLLVETSEILDASTTFHVRDVKCQIVFNNYLINWNSNNIKS